MLTNQSCADQQSWPTIVLQFFQKTQTVHYKGMFQLVLCLLPFILAIQVLFYKGRFQLVLCLHPTLLAFQFVQQVSQPHSFLR